jgi:hypothetical protein
LERGGAETRLVQLQARANDVYLYDEVTWTAKLEMLKRHSSPQVRRLNWAGICRLAPAGFFGQGVVNSKTGGK